MVDRGEFLRLAERCEGAAGADRELDVEICLALGWTYEKMKGDARAYHRKPGCTNYYQRSEPPEYTASLDAAMSLATGLERFGGVGGMLREAMERMSALPAMLSTMAPDEYRQTLARYFTAASLRALASAQEGGG